MAYELLDTGSQHRVCPTTSARRGCTSHIVEWRRARQAEMPRADGLEAELAKTRMPLKSMGKLTRSWRWLPRARRPTRSRTVMATHRRELIPIAGARRAGETSTPSSGGPASPGSGEDSRRPHPFVST